MADARVRRLQDMQIYTRIENRKIHVLHVRYEKGKHLWPAANFKIEVKIGQLIPLKNNNSIDELASKVPILEGVNVVGRENLDVPDKRVSRKHISLHSSANGSIEAIVEGSNPIILTSGGQRKKFSSQGKFPLVHDDILELIPGNHVYKYATICTGRPLLSPTNQRLLNKGKRHSEEEISAVKRNRQILEDEAFARTLQEESSVVEDDSLLVGKSGVTPSDPSTSVTSHEALEGIQHFSVPRERLPFTYRLMRVQGIPGWANSSAVTIEDVIEGNVLVAILSNYMLDIDWLMSACPGLRKVPRVLVVHGESGATVDYWKKKMPESWILHKPPLPISYGTHHSKAMLLIYPRGVRVVVHTANYIHVDWNNKTQALWMQDFPWKDQRDLSKSSSFETDLVDYLHALKWPEFRVNLPEVGQVSINASFFKKFDYSSARVKLVASVPGYHMGPNLKKWGHMKLRTLLGEGVFDAEFCKSPLVYQFSSLGSLDEKWLAEFALSMSSGCTNDKSPLGLGKPLIIWPTVEDVRCSLEGYSAGSAVPSPQKNVEKDFLKKYWARWRANRVGRCRAMPHIKTYTRYNGQNLAWFLLSSANLSKAAWGALQKNNSQLMIRSYELGVLFLPSTIQDSIGGFSCTERLDETKPTGPKQGSKTKLVTLSWKGKTEPHVEIIRLPVPYQLPPQPYTPEDVPWSWDRRYTKKDVYGKVWPSHS